MIKTVLKKLCYTDGMSKVNASHPFGKRLAILRKEQGLSQTELGKMMSVSRGMIAYYESSAKNPTIEVIEHAAETLGVSISFLVDEHSPTKRGPKSKLEKLTDKLSSLPKNKQKVVVDMLEGFLEKTS